MSEVKVNKISPRSGTDVTLGDSGDTIIVPAGVTLDASSGGLAGTLTTAAQPNITSTGTLTNFTSTGVDDNADALAMTIDSSENVGIGETAPLGKLHVKSGDSGVSSPDITDLVVECSGSGGMSLLGATNGQVEIAFGDSGDANIGRIAYNNNDNFLATVVNGAEAMRVHSNSVVSFDDGIALGVGAANNTAANVLDDYEEGTWTPAMDGMSQSNESGHYTKVGNLCTAKFKISPGGSGNNVSITGFPFTSQAGFEQNGWARETESAGNYWAIRLSGGAVAATIIRYDANVSVDTGDTFEGSITYITNT
jgi:hypothetical protein